MVNISVAWEVVLHHSYRSHCTRKSGKKEKMTLPKSDVIIFTAENGTKVAARPSGTEPKIKFYFSVHCPFNNRLEYTALRSDLIDSIDRMCVQLGLTA